MEQSSSRRYPVTVWILVFSLLLFLGVTIAMVVYLFSQQGNQAAEAYTQGRFIKIQVATGAIEGNVTQAAPENATADAYKQKRLQELTTAKPIEPAPDSKVPVDSAPEASAITQPSPPQEDAEAMPPAPSLSQQPAGSSILPPRQMGVAPVEGGISLKVVERKVAFPLNPVGEASIIETTSDGTTLPRMSEDGKLKPWSYYRKDFNAPSGAKFLSIVLTNLGLNQKLTQQALQMDERITLAFSPYAPELQTQVDIARQSGFETWMVLPLQHENYPIHDYGPLTLLAEESAEENKNQLLRIMASAQGIVGLVSSPDEQFSRNAQMQAIFDVIAGRGELFATYNKAFAPQKNASQLLPIRQHYHGGNVPATAEELFRDIEAQVNAEGRVVVTLASLPVIMEAMEAWVATLPASNIALVPLSAQVKQEETEATQSE